MSAVTWIDALQEAVQRRLATLADQVGEQLQRLAIHPQAAVLAGAVHGPPQRRGHRLAVGTLPCLHRPGLQRGQRGEE